jgi:pimeloyl-ACP methyl ester carboxylesterase
LSSPTIASRAAAQGPDIAAFQVGDGQVQSLDLGRVALRGWSFGGYLAALAVLRRPDLSTPPWPAPR